MNLPGLRKALLIFASATIAVGLVACGGGDDDDDDGNGNGGAQPTATTATNGNGNAEVTEVEVSMQDNFFEPKEIRIPAGVEVEITATNDGMAIHNMTVPGTDFKSDAIVAAGDSSTFTVKFDDAGTYEFQCDFHVPDMVGAFIVE